MICATTFQIPTPSIDPMELLPNNDPVHAPVRQKAAVDIAIRRSTITSAKLSMIRVDGKVVAGDVLNGLVRKKTFLHTPSQQAQKYARYAKLRV